MYHDIEQENKMKRTYETLKQAAVNAKLMSLINKNDKCFLGQAIGIVFAINFLVSTQDTDMPALSMSEIDELATEMLKRGTEKK